MSENEKEKDMVHHPKHYGGGGNPHEVVKCLAAWGLEKDALLWNAGKYIGRAYAKGDPAEQLGKACWYLCRRIAILEERDPNYYNDLFKVGRKHQVLGDQIGSGEIPVQRPIAKKVTIMGRPVEITPLEDFKVRILDGPLDLDFKFESEPLEGMLIKLKRCVTCGAPATHVGPKDYPGPDERHVCDVHVPNSSVGGLYTKLPSLAAQRWAPVLDKHEITGRASRDRAAAALEEVAELWKRSYAAATARFAEARKHFVEARERIVEAKGHFTEAGEGVDAAKDALLLRCAEIVEKRLGRCWEGDAIRGMGTDAIKGPALASVCLAGMCDHKKFGKECPPLDPAEAEEEAERQEDAKSAKLLDKSREIVEGLGPNADHREIVSKVADMVREEEAKPCQVPPGYVPEPPINQVAVRQAALDEAVRAVAEINYEAEQAVLALKEEDPFTFEAAKTKKPCAKKAKLDELEASLTNAGGEILELEGDLVIARRNVKYLEGRNAKASEQLEAAELQRDASLERAALIVDDVEEDSVEALLEAAKRIRALRGPGGLYKLARAQGRKKDALLTICAEIVRDTYGKHAAGAEKILDLGSDALRIRPITEPRGEVAYADAVRGSGPMALRASLETVSSFLMGHTACIEIYENAARRVVIKATSGTEEHGKRSRPVVVEKDLETAIAVWAEQNPHGSSSPGASSPQDTPAYLAANSVSNKEGRCGRCLFRPPPGTFMHDCAGKGLEPDHYVSRLEEQFDKLGVGLTKFGVEPVGRETGTDAALRVLEELRLEVYKLSVKGGGSDQTAHQLRIEQMMHGFGQVVPGKPSPRDEETRVLRARLILEECLETIYDGLRVEVSLIWSGPNAGCNHTVPYDRLKFKAKPGPADIVELADGCADVSVVTIGTLSAFGIKDAPLLREVDANNQAKVDKSTCDEFGKYVKPEGHAPPDIQRVLRKQAGFGEKVAVPAGSMSRWCDEHQCPSDHCRAKHPF